MPLLCPTRTPATAAAVNSLRSQLWFISHYHTHHPTTNTTTTQYILYYQVLFHSAAYAAMLLLLLLLALRTPLRLDRCCWKLYTT